MEEDDNQYSHHCVNMIKIIMIIRQPIIIMAYILLCPTLINNVQCQWMWSSFDGRTTNLKQPHPQYFGSHFA